jgi:hypothetical protein
MPFGSVAKEVDANDLLSYLQTGRPLPAGPKRDRRGISGGLFRCGQYIPNGGHRERRAPEGGLRTARQSG